MLICISSANMCINVGKLVEATVEVGEEKRLLSPNKQHQGDVWVLHRIVHHPSCGGKEGKLNSCPCVRENEITII